jgi:uncharacterized protein with FMN-binding domain
MRKKTKIVIYILVVLVLLTGGYAGLSFVRYKNLVQAVTIADVDLSSIDDGDYVGSYDLGLVSVKVKVRVEGNRIKRIEILEHKNGRGTAAEAIVNNVVKAQSLEVDVIAGATASSKAILKAVENALSMD